MIILQIPGADQFLAGCVLTLHTTGEQYGPGFPMLYKMHWLCATTNRGWLAVAGWDNTADSWLQVWPHVSNCMPVAAPLLNLTGHYTGFRRRPRQGSTACSGRSWWLPLLQTCSSLQTCAALLKGLWVYGWHRLHWRSCEPDGWQNRQCSRPCSSWKMCS